MFTKWQEWRRLMAEAGEGDGDGGSGGGGDSLLDAAVTDEGDGDSGHSGDSGAPQEWLLADGVKGDGETPEWFKAGKYKTVAEQAKAYSELEKRLGGFTGAPEEYELSFPEGVEGEFYEDDPRLDSFKEIAKKHNMSQEAFDEILHTYVEHEASVFASSQQAEMEKLGDNAASRIKHIAEWAKANMSEEGFEHLRGTLTTADNVMAVEELIGKAKGARLANEDEAGTQNAGVVSAEAVRAMAEEKDSNGNRRIETDPQFRRKYREALRKSVGEQPHREIVG